MTRVYREPEMVALDEFRMVELYVDDPVVGCGHRRFVVLAMSAKKVRLFSAPRLATITVDRATFDRYHVPARKVIRGTLDRIIRANIALADRVNDRAQTEIMTDGGADAQRVLQLLGHHTTAAR